MGEFADFDQIKMEKYTLTKLIPYQAWNFYIYWFF